MTQMQAIVYDEFGGADKLYFTERPIPVPKENEVLIKIHYASVNPVDWKIREGLFAKRLKHDFPIIPGWDAAGTIVALGVAVNKFNVGDEVYAYCFKDVISEGTYAEYISFDAENVALKPANCSFAESAALPLVSLTAWQALFNVGKLQKGETIFIQSGSGGVGSIAIQLAKWAGATVITTSGPNNLEFVKSLGADFVVDYTKDSVESTIKNKFPNGVDFVLDMFGGKILRNSLSTLKKGSRFVSIYENMKQEEADPYGVESRYVFVRPNGKELNEISALLEADKLKPPVVEEFLLKDAAAAQEQNRAGHTRGKIVLKNLKI